MKHMMKHAIKSFSAGEEQSGETTGYIFPHWLMVEHWEGRGVGEPAMRVGCWVTRRCGRFMSPHPLLLILCAHDKVPHSPLSHLLEMSLHVGVQPASRDGMKMGINANENWAFAFCLTSQWLFPSFPRLSPYTYNIALLLSHLPRLN